MSEHRKYTQDDVAASGGATFNQPINGYLCPLSPSLIGQYIGHDPVVPVAQPLYRLSKRSRAKCRPDSGGIEMTSTRQTPAEFFYEQAAHSYNPRQETEEEGRRRGAERLAAAERWANENGYSFHWDHDTGEWYDAMTGEYRECWVCVCYDGDGNVAGSLGAIDFEDNAQPWGQPYRRVVEAELALEAMEY